MDLDDQNPISNQFNKEAALNAITKRVSEVQFTPKEQERYFDIRRTHTEETQKEERSFNNPEEYKRRVQEKEKALFLKHSRNPRLDNNPKNMQTGSLWVRIRNEARKQVRLEHEGKIQNSHDHYIKNMTALVDGAEKNQKQTQSPLTELEKMQQRSDEINQSRQENRDRNRDNGRGR